jgi:hypothetical protein
MSNSLFTREVIFQAAYDKRDPNPSKNYGVHGVHIWFSVIHKTRQEGLTFSVSTGWQLPHVQREFEGRKTPLREPMAFGVNIHTKTPRYAGQSSTQGRCVITGGKCYCDGSDLLGEDFLKTLIEGGDEALFACMEQQFFDWSPNV